MASPDMRHLLRVLQERNIPLGEDDIAWAFEGKNTRDDATAWVKEYLGASTLLSKDELRFYEKHGIDAAPGDSTPGRPLDDDELEAAIDSLEASTAAIDRQCQMLEQQKVALQKLKAQNGHHDAELLAREKRQQKFAREKAQLDFDIDELSLATKDRLKTLVKQNNASTGSVDANVNRLLEKDDRLLDGLQKLLPKLGDSSLDTDGAAEVEHLCATLTELSVQSIRSRLDGTYRQNLLDYTRCGTPTAGLSEQQSKQRETLHAELEELGGEIEGLVSIVVDNQYRKSLKTGQLSARAERQTQKARLAEYSVAALVYLTSRLDAISNHIEHLHAHGAALRSISRTLEGVVTVEQVRPGAAAPTTPAADRQAAARGLKPLRLVQANMSETQDPAIPFLRDHDIRIPEPIETGKLATLLETAVHDKYEKLQNLHQTTEETITDVIVQSLATSEGNIQELLRAVYAQSRHGTINLIDSQVQHSLDDLEHSTQSVGDEMRELDIDRIAKVVRGKQEEALRRLGG